MTDSKIAALSDRAVLFIAGEDAQKFLQGLVTNDVDKLAPGGAIHTALLTPQGKMLFDFFILRSSEGFLIDAPLSIAADLAKRLGFYKLRAKVEILNRSDELASAAAWAGDEPAGEDKFHIFADPRNKDLGWRIIAKKDQINALSGADLADYHAHRIGLGIPEGGKDYKFGATFPHEANLDVLGGVDFDKGCFVGQEVVSRMQHRGTARKRVVPVASASPLPESGSEIRAGSALIGTLGSTSGNSGLALIRLDRAAEAVAKGEAIKAGEIEIKLLQPAWAPFKVPTGSP